MANALVALNYIKQPDGSYRLHFPINTTNEVYYDIDNNVTLKKYLSTITPGGIMHTVETDEDRLALTVATVKLMDVVKVTGDKNALYYVTDIEKLGTEEGFTPFVDPDKFVSKENSTGEEGGTTIINDAFVGESPSNEVTYGDMIIDMPKGLEDGTVSIDMTVKNANIIDFDYITDRTVDAFPEQETYTTTLRSCLSPNGLYLYIEVSNGTEGKGIMYAVNGTRLTYMNTVLSFIDLVNERACTFTNDSKCIVITDSTGFHYAYRNVDNTAYIYRAASIIADRCTVIKNVPGQNVLVAVDKSSLVRAAAFSIDIDYSTEIPSLVVANITSTYYIDMISNFSPAVCDVSADGKYIAFGSSNTDSTAAIFETNADSATATLAYRFSVANMKIHDIACNSGLKYIGVCSNNGIFRLYNMTTGMVVKNVPLPNCKLTSCAFTYGSEAFVAIGSMTDTRRMIATVDMSKSNLPYNIAESGAFVSYIGSFKDILISPISNSGYLIHDKFTNITPFVSNGDVLREVISTKTDAFISPVICVSADNKYCASIAPHASGLNGVIDLYKFNPDGSVLFKTKTLITMDTRDDAVISENPIIYTAKWIDNILMVSHNYVDNANTYSRVSMYKYNETTNTLDFFNKVDTYGSTPVRHIARSDYFSETTAWLTHITDGGQYIHFFKVVTTTTAGITVDTTRYNAGWIPNATIIDVAFYKRYMVVLYNASPYIKILKYEPTSTTGYSVPETVHNADLTLPSVPTSVQVDTAAKRMIITYANAPYVEVYSFNDVGNDLDHVIEKVDSSNHVNLPQVPLQWSKLIYNGRYALFCKNGNPKEYYLGTFTGNKLAIISSGKLDNAIINSSTTKPEFNNEIGCLIETDSARPFGHIFKTSDIGATTSIHIEGKLDKATNSWTNATITSSNDMNIENIYLTYNEETGRTCIVIVPKYDTWFEGYVSIDKITYQGVSNIDTKYEVSFGDFLTDGDYTNLYEYIKEVESNTNELLNNRSVVTKDVIENVEITTDGWVNKLDTLGYYVYTIKSDLIKSTSTVMMDVIGVLGAEIANNASVISNTTEYNGYSEIYAVDLPTGSFFVNITIIN